MKRLAMLLALVVFGVGCRSEAKPERSGGPTAEEVAALIEIQKEIERLEKEKIAAGAKFIP